MVSTAIRSQSSTIARLDTTVSPNAYNTIVNINSISGPNLEAPEIDVSDLSSTSREFLQGLKDGGVIELAGFYNPNDSEHQILRNRVGTTTTDTYKITLADVSPNATVSFTGRVLRFGTEIAVDQAVTMTVSIKLSGDPTYSS